MLDHLSAWIEGWYIADRVCDVGCFASGGYDGIIRLYSSDGDINAELVGHTAGITSLAHGPNGTLISGSWDGTARVVRKDNG